MRIGIESMTEYIAMKWSFKISDPAGLNICLFKNKQVSEYVDIFH